VPGLQFYFFSSHIFVGKLWPRINLVISKTPEAGKKIHGICKMLNTRTKHREACLIKV